MYSNPIVERQKQEEEEQRKKDAFRYPYKVCCVYRNSENDFPIIHEVRAHCHTNHVVFTGREYDVDKFEEDSWICRLPAFHLYYNNGHIDITYFDTDPVRAIQKEIWDYEDKLRAKEKRKQQRAEQWKAVKERMIGLFKRKSRLDLDASLSARSK